MMANTFVKFEQNISSNGEDDSKVKNDFRGLSTFVCLKYAKMSFYDYLEK